MTCSALVLEDTQHPFCYIDCELSAFLDFYHQTSVCLFHIVPSPMDCSQLNNVCCISICKTSYIWTHLVITPHLQDRHFNQHFKNEETETEIHTYNLGVWKVKAGGSVIQSQPWLPSDFMASLGYTRWHFILFFQVTKLISGSVQHFDV